MTRELDVTAPILVLGLGNLLLHDDAVGLRLLEMLTEGVGTSDGRIEYVDGGTQGIALLGQLANRQALIVLDAVANKADPGTIHILSKDEVLASGAGGGSTSHESSAGELLRTALLVGDLPEKIAVVGIEPDEVKTGIGLSPEVEKSLALAATRAEEIIRQSIRGFWLTLKRN